MDKIGERKEENAPEEMPVSNRRVHADFISPLTPFTPFPPADRVGLPTAPAAPAPFEESLRAGFVPAQPSFILLVLRLSDIPAVPECFIALLSKPERKRGLGKQSVLNGSAVCCVRENGCVIKPSAPPARFRRLRRQAAADSRQEASATPGTTATAIWSAGGGNAPKGAQSPQQSARTILSGVSKNERLVLGDDSDASGARSCFNPDAAKYADEYLLNVARKRRKGELAV